jgi:hypothetical protein
MQLIKQWIKRNFSGLIYRRQKNIARKYEMLKWLEQFGQEPVVALSETSFNIFTYHGEDGIIAYLLQKLNNVPKTFVDIGAGDCIKSNCAALAEHFGWGGVFIDKDERLLAIGKSFYRNKVHHGADIRFVKEHVTVESINETISGNTITGDIGLLSIDIDGNDYWIWRAIEVIKPRIVVIEAKVEFGYHDAVVPYGPHNHHAVHRMYNGASIEALKKLGEAKGYKLAGGNKQGYNLFFVRADEVLPAVTIADVLSDGETVNSFYHDSFFAEHKFVTEYTIWPKSELI